MQKVHYDMPCSGTDIRSCIWVKDPTVQLLAGSVIQDFEGTIKHESNIECFTQKWLLNCA